MCQSLSDQGILLAQALIETSDRASASLLEQDRFIEIAELLYLHGMVPTSAVPPLLPGGVRLESYSAENHADFAKAILGSYQNSLDCPRLNGVRDIEDIIAGHKACGQFDPKLWFLLRDRSEPAGVLLLNPAHRNEAVELVYLGLAPVAQAPAGANAHPPGTGGRDRPGAESIDARGRCSQRAGPEALLWNGAKPTVPPRPPTCGTFERIDGSIVIPRPSPSSDNCCVRLVQKDFFDFRPADCIVTCAV